MRVELLYSPGCNAYKSVRNTLETVIAEERLPIPVELVEENSHSNPPLLRIDGHEFRDSTHTLEHLRDLLCGQWHEHAGSALHKTY
jgi:hypothetical protein